MPLDTDIRGRLIIRFSRANPPLGRDHGQLTDSEAVKVDKAAHLLNPSLATTALDVSERGRLTPEAVQRSQDSSAKGYLEHAFFVSSRPSRDTRRFNVAGEYEALYLAFDECTAIAEVRHYHAPSMQANKHASASTPRWFQGIEVELTGEGRYFDLRGADNGEYSDCLNPDIAIGHPAGQALATRLLQEGYDGIIYPSVRKIDGVCVALFDLRKITFYRLGSGMKLELDKFGNVVHSTEPRPFESVSAKPSSTD